MLRRTIVSGVSLFLFAALFALSVETANSQVISSVVGGVAIDEGVLRAASRQENDNLSQNLSRVISNIPDGLNQESPYRKISLKMVNAEIERCVSASRVFAPELCFLGGLTSIKYVVADPENNDVLIIGQAEPWRSDDMGNVVGKNSGKSIMLLQDLITLFRAWDTERPAVITCSIDPTPEALVRVQQILQTPVRQGEERARAYALEQANGNHVLTIKGVPEASRFATVLAAADFKLKQIGLGHEKAPKNIVPSYVSLLNSRSRNASQMPRFWFAPEYDSIQYDSKEQIWDIGGLKVKTLTEARLFDVRSGKPVSTGRIDGTAERWCELMNKNFDKLSTAEPVFSDMKNCMDLAMAVAVIHRERLLEKANCKITAFSQEARLHLPTYPVPKYVSAKSIINKNVIACGGVEINPFSKLNEKKLNASLDILEKPLTAPTGNAWYANAELPKR
ncbi:MAG: DUF1598 domain-containing protein [Planctomycetaceae bacterium]|jgi:hypothetical protein|nr:DUF1598 domain-containing protein [Planctomycetaceae bacterium]